MIATDQVLIDVLERQERRGARFRWVFSAAVLVAIVSLIVATVATVRSLDQARRLEVAASQLAQAAKEREAIAARLAAVNRVLGSARASAAQVTAAKAEGQALSSILPAASDGGFRVPQDAATGAVQLLTLGSPTGWDIDVFWCAASGYPAGRTAAERLAGFAAGSRAVAPGVRLGRIRLRPIQPRDMALWRPAMGRDLLVATDGGAGEAEAAAAVLGALAPGLVGTVVDQRQLASGLAASKWYLSVIVCPAAG